MRPHLVRWEKQYSDAGLLVIEINRCIGEPLPVMRCMVESHELKHPVLWDAGCGNTNAYGITAWPFAYLIGADGNVFWQGNPTRWIHHKQKVDQMRDCLEKELSKARPSPHDCVPAVRAHHPVRCVCNTMQNEHASEERGLAPHLKSVDISHERDVTVPVPISCVPIPGGPPPTAGPSSQ